MLTELWTTTRSRLIAAITDGNPHHPNCQMRKPVPAGFPFPTFTCNCRGRGVRMPSRATR